jgi:hypothetical protein
VRGDAWCLSLSFPRRMRGKQPERISDNPDERVRTD